MFLFLFPIKEMQEMLPKLIFWTGTHVKKKNHFIIFRYPDVLLKCIQTKEDPTLSEHIVNKRLA